MKILYSLLACALSFAMSACGGSANPQSGASVSQKPFCDDMRGKVFCGYQGWYRVPSDGSGLGWEHWETIEEEFEPGKCGIDAWPDVSELDEDEKIPTKFRHADGSVAYVYTNENAKTVNRHFKWMKDYGIDGVFLQRFALDVTGGHHQSNLLLPSNNRVLENVLKGAENNQRTFAIMYDLTGMGKDNDANSLQKVKKDWMALMDKYKLFDSPSYMRHKGKPVVAIYGIGFGDRRNYTIEEQIDLIDFFKNDKKYGGCSIVLGVPTYWRTLDKDTISDARVHDMIRSADVLLPWFVGRFGMAGVENHAKNQYVPDAKWCRENNILYMPLAFPGFSWANRYIKRNEKFDKIPREGGKFFWKQIYEIKKAGAETLYVAMFDEMDEATQVFKVTNNPPVGPSRFLSNAPEDPDFYLRLCQQAGKLLRGEIQPSENLPIASKSNSAK